MWPLNKKVFGRRGFLGLMSQRFVVRVLKLIFVVSTLSFAVIQIQLRRSGGSGVGGGGEGEKSRPFINELTREAPQQPHTSQHKEVDAGAGAAEIGTPPTKENASKAGSGLPKPSLDDIRRSIEFNNLNAEILNLGKFGSLTNIDSIILVQVHNRSNYLEKLVESLGKAEGINGSLIIFSHDFYSPEINSIIRRITFSRVLQIFYPYSIQIFPDRFPGQDPKDCEANIGKDKAEAKQCQNWQHPDKYGHYRVAKLTQIKHHWWWKMNYIFDGIPHLKKYNGYVLLLEEDHYVSPDALYVLNYIIKNKKQLCEECGVISLGFYLKSYTTYGSNIARLAVHPWFSSRHNMGMALNRDTWNRLKNCSHLFCTYDDYNWDWSLMRVNLQCLKPGRLTVIYAKAPRVFHIGDCGVHHKCRADSSAQKVAAILDGVKGSLYPPNLEVSERSKRMLRPPKENGGWGDVRDHNLCLNNTRQSGTP